jgi:hypothetical protein
MEFPISENGDALSDEIEEVQRTPHSLVPLDTDVRLYGLGDFHVFPDIFLAKFFLVPFWLEYVASFLLFRFFLTTQGHEARSDLSAAVEGLVPVCESRGRVAPHCTADVSR